MQINNAIPLTQTNIQKKVAEHEVQKANQDLRDKGLKYNQKLGQNDFLKLLVTQLKHQDPLSPLKDKEFIAQMAQFSSLEQMKNINKSVEKLIRQSSISENYNLLGKEVTWFNSINGKFHRGVVNSIEKPGGIIKLNIGGYLIDPASVVKIKMNVIEK